MHYTLDFLQDEGIIQIIDEGKFVFEDFIPQAEETMKATQKHNCSLILVDCSAMTASDIRVMKMMQMPKEYEKMYAPRSNRIALIQSKDPWTNKNLEFYETVCVNQGWLVRMFKDRFTAIKWLKE